MCTSESHVEVVVAEKVTKMDEENRPPSDEQSKMITKIENELESTEKKKSLKQLVTDTLMSRYFYASLVYLAYAAAMVHIMFISNETYNNALYFQFAIVHCFNACMYAYAWNGISWTSFYMYPEYLNIIGSGLYLWSSTMYNERYESDDYYADFSTQFALCRKAELSAAIVEWFAAIGWNYVWYAQFEKERGSMFTHTTWTRGLTIFDPDFTAAVTMFVAATIYVIYNIQVSGNYDAYSYNYLYFKGDIIYLVNAIFYLLAALRDYGWFQSWDVPNFIRSLTNTKV